MINAVTMALLLGLSNPLAGLNLLPGRDVQASHQEVGGWRLDVKHDQFSGRTTCRLKRGPVTYERQVVTFRFASWVDTANAEFRIDNGALQSVGSVAVEAAGLGARLRSDNSTNPSGGLVAIPSRLVANAGSVSIRPNPKRGHKDFVVKGLTGALAVAQQKGCDVASQVSKMS